MDRCRQERLAALRRLIEDAEASGISECSAEEIFAEARTLSGERRGKAVSEVEGRDGRCLAGYRKIKRGPWPFWPVSSLAKITA